MTTRGFLSLGIAGSLGPAAGARVAVAAEQAGFHTLWVNDTADGDSLAVLAAAAAVTERIGLATGVIAVDRRSADDIAAAVASHDLPRARLTLGVGSGQLRQGALKAVRETVDTLRAEAALRVVVGALGPKMRALAVEHGDGVLLNWLTPETAAGQAREARALVPDTSVILYARTSVDAAARGRRDAEAARYAGFPNYAANFERLGIDVLDTVLPRRDEDVAAGAETFAAAVDELVLRAITPTDDVDAYLRFVDTAAEALDLRG